MTYESSRSNRTDGDRRRRRGGSIRGARRERLEHGGDGQPFRDRRRGFGELDRRPHVPEHDEYDREPNRDRVAGALAIAGPASDLPVRAGGVARLLFPFFLRHGGQKPPEGRETFSQVPGGSAQSQSNGVRHTAETPF